MVLMGAGVSLSIPFHMKGEGVQLLLSRKEKGRIRLRQQLGITLPSKLSSSAEVERYY